MRIQGEQRGYVRAGGMAHQINLVWVAAVTCNIVPHPAHGQRAIRDKGRKNHLGIHPVIRQHHDESARSQCLGHKAVIRFAPATPGATIKENDHAGIGRQFFGQVNVQLLARIGAIGKIRGADITPAGNRGVEQLQAGTAGQPQRRHGHQQQD